MKTTSAMARMNLLVILLLILLPVGLLTLNRVRESRLRADTDYAAQMREAVASLQKAGKYPEALSAARKWGELQPQNGAAWRTVGISAIQSGDLSMAQTALQKAVAIDPHDNSAWATLGTVLLAQKKYPDAEAASRNALKGSARNTEAVLCLAQSLLAQNKNEDEAESLAREAVRLESGNAAAHFVLSELILKSKKGTDAKAAAVRGLALDPANPHGFDLLAQANTLLGETANAQKAADTATALHRFAQDNRLPIPDPIRLASGESLLEAGKYKEALAQFIAVLRRDLTDAGALEGAGIALWSLNQKGSASAYLTETLRHDRLRIRARVVLGLAAYDNLLFQSAVHHFSIVTEIQPGNALAWHTLGKAYTAERLHDVEAEKALRHACEIEPSNTFYAMDLADVLKTNAKTAEAETLYRHALAITPDDPDVCGRFGAFLTELPPDDKRHSEAQNLLEKAVKIVPEDTFSQYHLGRLLVEAGKYAESVSPLEKAAQNGKGRTKDVWSSLARAYRYLKQPEKAAAAIARADKIQKENEAYDRAAEVLGSNLNSASARLAMARASTAHGEPGRALAEYASYLRRNPNDTVVKKEQDVLIVELKAKGEYPDMTLYNNIALSTRIGK